jgi:hypothetical protein
MIAYMTPYLMGENLPKAQQILVNLCGDDRRKWQQAEQTAIIALQARQDFLTGIHQVISQSKAHVLE